MSIDNQLKQGLGQLGLTLTDSQRGLLTDYLALLQKWNRAYNLTAIRDPETMVTHHLLDSLALVPHLKASPLSVIDVGTGAGLPGIVLAAACPQHRFTLLDSNGKKTRFLMQAKIELGLANCSIVNDRVEAFQPEQRFDVVVSRAFTALQDFVQITEHLCQPEGLFLAMKGQYPAQELAALPPDSFRVLAVETLQVPGLAEARHLVKLNSK